MTHAEVVRRIAQRINDREMIRIVERAERGDKDAQFDMETAYSLYERCFSALFADATRGGK